MNDREKLRVFISYSHEDQQLVKQIVRVLRANDVVPIFDKNFAFGSGFHEQIKLYIAHAHIFMPVITESSVRRGWVHQEIGYAAALNVPVLPVTFGALPGEMIGQLHAAKLDSFKESKSKAKSKRAASGISRRVVRRLESVLTKKDLFKLVRRSRKLSQAKFECAPLPEERTINMVDYAQTVMDIQESVPDLANTSRVRQLGGLSSFGIPNLPLKHSQWNERFGGQDRSEHYRRLQRDERRALTKLAEASGCRLIVNHMLDYGNYGPVAQIARLRAFADFLESDEVADVEVAFNTDVDRAHNLTIVGDWYCAESVAARAGHGYDQTVFTRHAPSMNARIEAFDELFVNLLGDVKPRDSRYVAIQTLQDRIHALLVEQAEQLQQRKSAAVV